MHFTDAAKYFVETNRPAIFTILEVSQKWYNSLPKDLQEMTETATRSLSQSMRRRCSCTKTRARSVSKSRPALHEATGLEFCCVRRAASAAIV